MTPLVLAGISVALGLLLGAIAVWFLTKPLRGKKNKPMEIHADFVFQRVRAVGRLVGLEVSAKEIATSTRGLSWMPPLLLSQARVAMIFRFEKQYSIELGKIPAGAVEELEGDRFAPYDIQAGKVMGLLDVIPVGAATQKELMQRAQTQAAELYEQADERYEAEAMHSIERQLTALLAMFGIDVDVRWEAAESVMQTSSASAQTDES